MTRFMTRASLSYQRIALISLVTVVYGALLVMAAGCVFAHADRAQSHHHHDEQGSSVQNVLCAWACHATADITVAVGPPSIVAELVVELSSFTRDLPICPISSSTVHPRAPPSMSFARLG